MFGVYLTVRMQYDRVIKTYLSKKETNTMFMLRGLAAIAQLEAVTVSHQGKLVGLYIASFTTDGEFITGIYSILFCLLCLFVIFFWKYICMIYCRIGL